MRVHITVTDERGKQYEGEADLIEVKSTSRVKRVIKNKTPSANEYKGLVGGISFLIYGGFFKKLVSVDEVHAELKKEGYTYPYNSVDKVLRVDFVHKKRTLTRDRENGIWKYALRK